MNKKSLDGKLKKIKLVLLDVDGVLTDGKIIYDSLGVEYKNFHAHDGFGIVRGKRLGLRFGILSGRSSPIVDKRAEKLGMEFVIQDREDKLNAFREFKSRYNFIEDETAFIGDDEFDLELLKAVAFSACPSNAVSSIRKSVHYIAKAAGGNGAVREVIDMILKAQKKIK
jgi:3-deoxy-D-manno-octulosonate 8-phosphate phosphatase (KDO 8-P phosphatase)